LAKQKLKYLFASADLIKILDITPSVKTRLSMIREIGSRLVDPKAKAEYILGLFRYSEEKQYVEEILKARVQNINSSLFKTSSGNETSKSTRSSFGGRGGRGGSGRGNFNSNVVRSISLDSDVFKENTTSPINNVEKAKSCNDADDEIDIDIYSNTDESNTKIINNSKSLNTINEDEDDDDEDDDNNDSDNAIVAFDENTYSIDNSTSLDTIKENENDDDEETFNEKEFEDEKKHNTTTTTILNTINEDDDENESEERDENNTTIFVTNDDTSIINENITIEIVQEEEEEEINKYTSNDIDEYDSNDDSDEDDDDDDDSEDIEKTKIFIEEHTQNRHNKKFDTDINFKQQNKSCLSYRIQSPKELINHKKAHDQKKRESLSPNEHSKVTSINYGSIINFDEVLLELDKISIGVNVNGEHNSLDSIGI
jgi:hypothetical protein